MFPSTFFLFGFAVLINVQPIKAKCTSENRTPTPYRNSQVFAPEMRDPRNKDGCDLSTASERPFETLHNQCKPPSEKGQCTEWADGRFYQITGQHIEFSGSATSWPDQARQNPSRWVVSDTPTVPSVAISPPGIGGAGPGGHSAVIEYEFAPGDFCTTNWNAPTAARLAVLRTQHIPGMTYISLKN